MLKRETFELRFFPIAVFFGHQGDLLDSLYRDPKTKKNNFEHWQWNQNQIILFDADKSRSFMCSYQNCAYTSTNPPTANFAHDQILKYFRSVADFFGDRLDNIQRIGLRQTHIVPVKDFDELAKRLANEFVKLDNPLIESLGGSVADLKLFPLVFKHGANKFQVTLGPTRKEELRPLWSEDAEFPDQALFLDVDYYAIQPKVIEVERYVAEFLVKARETFNRVSSGVLPMAEGV